MLLCAPMIWGNPKTMGSLCSNEFGGQVQLQLHFVLDAHINPWKQGILGKLPCAKTNFSSCKKWDKLQMVNFKFNLKIFGMFNFTSFMNCNVFFVAMYEFCLMFLTKIDLKSVFSAFTFSNKNLTLYR